MKDLKQFLELFNPLPANQYLEICDKKDELTFALEKLLQKVDGELKIILYNDANLSLEKPFRATPREHDMVIIKNIYAKHQNQNMLLTLSYKTLAHTANIIIIEKKGVLDIEALKEKLELFEFRSANNIDIIKDYDLVIAKKMHMWGNGL